jgi:hypothetical protein
MAGPHIFLESADTVGYTFRLLRALQQGQA